MCVFFSAVISFLLYLRPHIHFCKYCVVIFTYELLHSLHGFDLCAIVMFWAFNVFLDVLLT